MITVTVTNRKAVAVPLTDVTVGAVGIPVSFHFTEDWDGLSKIAVFKAGDVTPVEVAILNNTAVVPHEVLVDEYEVLWIGIYGSNAQGTTVIPTIWANAGAIQPGTELETIDPSEPTPSWVAQVQAAAEEALTIANEIKDDAESGAFDGEDGTDGVSPTVTVTDITGGHLVTITDANGSHSFSVMNGTDGQNGSDGQPGANGSDGRDGVDGQDGTDGISPTITIVNIDGGHRVTMTDVNGSHSFDVLNGQDGSTGPQGGTGPAGATGAAGRGIRAFYPNGTSTVGDVTYDSYLMEFTDDTTFTLNVRRGAKGDVGPAGNDGITPTVEVTEIEGGHNVAFDYGTGDSRNRDFDVMDGGTGADKAPVITDTASGAIASFPDGAVGLPLKSLVAQIEPQQDLHGYDSPWPAGGGSNILPYPFSETTKTVNGITFTDNGDGTITVNGTATATAFFNMVSGGALPVKAGTYTFSGSSGRAQVVITDNSSHYTTESGYTATYDTDTTINIFIRVASGATVSNAVVKPQINKGSAIIPWTPYSNVRPISGWTGAEIEQAGINLFDKSTVTHGYKILGTGQVYPDSNMAYTDYIPVRQGMTLYCSPGWQPGLNVIFFYDSGKQIIGKNANNTHIYITPDNCRYIRLNMLETEVDTATVNYPSTDTSYHAYTGSSLSINWQDSAGTVYGGNLAIAEDGSCKLTVDRIMFDISTLSWVYTANNNRFYASKPSTLPDIVNNETISDRYVYGNTATQNNTIQPTTSQIYIKDERFTDAASLAASLSGSQTLFKLATPITYILPNVTMLETVLGTNNIWVGTGDTTVEYRCSTKLYIQKMIASALNS